MKGNKTLRPLEINLPSHQSNEKATKAEILAQAADIAGHFMLSLHHNGFIRKNAIASKTFVRRKFEEFIKRTKQSIWFLTGIKSDQLLTDHGYLNLTFVDENLFKFSLKKLFEYRNKIIDELDQHQIHNASCNHITSYDYENQVEKIKPTVDPESKKYDLNFKLRFMQHINEQFITSSKGCYCCQKNFVVEADYIQHIDHHTEESDFQFISANTNDALPARFEISYRHCLNSHLLLFTIKDLCHIKTNIVIEKVIFFRSSSIVYLEDDLTPFDLIQEGNEFYVDLHLFELQIEQPIIIVYKFKEDIRTRFLEQHHFLRFENFPLVSNHLSNHVFSRDILSLKEELKKYYPNDVAKALCPKDVEAGLAVARCSLNIRNYFNEVDTLNHVNVCEVFELLLQIEDHHLSSEYDVLTQKKARVNGAGSDYSVQLNLPPHIKIENILSPFDEVRLTSSTHRNEYKKPIVIIGRITRIGGKRVFFELRYGKLSIHDTFAIKFAPQRLSIIFQHRALQSLRINRNLRERLFPEENISQETSSISLKWFNKTIEQNPQQQDAVKNIVDNKNRHVPFVIFGPPGTGKTTVVVETILQLWNQSKSNRILVTAGSNAACDEIAKRLIKILKQVDPNAMAMLRIYAASAEKRAENLNEDVLEASNLYYGTQFYPSVETVSTYPIVIVTLTVAGKYVHGKMPSSNFTHVFIDECGASTEIESMVAIAGMLSVSGHLIISGDPKQLGPIIQNNHAAKFGLDRSLLERLMDRKCYEKDPITNQYNKSIQARLVRNYRSHKDILCLPNKMYYDGDLEVHAPPDITDWALGWNALNAKQFPILFESVKGIARRLNSTSLCNFEELRSVIYYVKELMYFGINDRKIVQEDIGIVSPYKKQCNLIRCELDKRGWFQIETGSVETFQGKEKPIIIASMVRSRMDGPGFLDSPKRLNVLITRAQALLIIIGNPETLIQINGWKEVVEYCYENNAIRGANFDIDDTKSNDGSSVASSLQNLSITRNNGGCSSSNQSPRKRTHPSPNKKKPQRQREGSPETSLSPKPHLVNWIQHLPESPPTKQDSKPKKVNLKPSATEAIPKMSATNKPQNAVKPINFQMPKIITAPQSNTIKSASDSTSIHGATSSENINRILNLIGRTEANAVDRISHVAEATSNSEYLNQISVGDMKTRRVTYTASSKSNVHDQTRSVQPTAPQLLDQPPEPGLLSTPKIIRSVQPTAPQLHDHDQFPESILLSTPNTIRRVRTSSQLFVHDQPPERTLSRTPNIIRSVQPAPPQLLVHGQPPIRTLTSTPPRTRIVNPQEAKKKSCIVS